MTTKRFNSGMSNADTIEIRKSKSSGLVFDRDVGCTVLLSFVLVVLMGFGGLTAGVAWERVPGVKGDLLILGGLLLSGASFVSFGFFIYSLDRYFYRPEDVQYYEREIEVERPARYEVQMAPNTLRIGRHDYPPLFWSELAKRCWRNGEWIAGTHFRRAHIQDFTTNYTEVWKAKTIQHDFRDWNYVVEDGRGWRWLDAGKDGIGEYLNE